eukprot:scaffold42923_cov44-Phaeocystis_antarctica.AAC.2
MPQAVLDELLDAMTLADEPPHLEVPHLLAPRLVRVRIGVGPSLRVKDELHELPPPLRPVLAGLRRHVDEQRLAHGVADRLHIWLQAGWYRLGLRVDEQRLVGPSK